MSNKVSAIAVVGLSAVCLGLLWNQKNASRDVPVDEVAVERPAGAPETRPVVEKFGRGTVSVSSQEVRKFVADEFVVHFEISQKNKDKNKAFTQLGENREKILALFKKLDIGKSNFEQASVNVREDWSYVNSKQKLNGYVASQIFKVYFSSKEKVESLEKEFAAFPFVVSVSSRGQLKNADAMEVETIKGACKKATERAEEFAHSVGAKVGTVVTVDGNSNVSAFNYSDSVSVYASVEASMRLQGKNQSKNSYITVNQYERKKFLADKFEVTARILVEGKDKESLYKTTSEKRIQVETLAKDLGVAASEIEAQSMSIRKKSDWELRNPERAKNPFVANQSIQVNFLSKDGAVAFFSALAEIENVMPQSPVPTVRNEDSLRVEVTNIAGKKALARAKALAEGFGGKMGDVVNVGDNMSRGYDEMVLDEVVYEDDMTNGAMLRGKSAMLLGAGGNSSGLNIADSVEISSFISVVTELKF